LVRGDPQPGSEVGARINGRVRHSDHRTIVLPDWHQVLMNTENQSAAMRYVAFVD